MGKLVAHIEWYCGHVGKISDTAIVARLAGGDQPKLRCRACGASDQFRFTLGHDAAVNPMETQRRDIA